MKRIINGKMYDTDTATLVADYEPDYDNSWDECWHQILYITQTKEWFLYGEGNPWSQDSIFVSDNSFNDSSAIEPFTSEQAKEWLADRNFVDEYINYFGEPEE